jgi:D-glycero-alpha-D-manno-heptose-7-phosphate kinase
MIGTRTPFRMSFVGGGSDLKEFYSRSPGSVVSVTINKYMYIFIHQFFDNRIQIKYSKTELVERIEEIKHPIVREALRNFGLNGVDINSIADIPASTGLGSSSSFTVGLLHALYAYCYKYVSVEKLAKKACELEIDILKEPIGKQDQYAAAYGGLNFIRFYPNGEVGIEPIIMKPSAYNKLQQNLLLFYTGTTRSTAEILKDQKQNITDDKKKFKELSKMADLAEDMLTCLVESDIEQFGDILDQNWQLKKRLSEKISGSKIDEIYEKAKNNGALGGKLLGAGGGGFLLFYCELEHQEKLRGALSQLKEIKFNFESSGSKIIYCGDLNCEN